MRIFTADLADGDAIDQAMLVREREVRTNKNGHQYFSMDLADRSGSISSRLWNIVDADLVAFEPGDFIHVRGKVQLFQGALQLIVGHYERKDPALLDLADFVPATLKDVNVLLSDLRAALGKVKRPQLAALAQAYLVDRDLMQKYLRAPAGIRNHHAYVGGLLEHVVSLLKVYDRIADLYPELDPDIMRIGIFLHDVGKLRELDFDREFRYSDEGQLIGHLVIGVEMLSGKLIEVERLLGEPFPKDLADQLKHVILSHHGTYEYGSPRLPMTVEAIAIHHLDNLDAKVNAFARAIKEDANAQSKWTNYDPKLQRKLFKGDLGRSAAPAKPKPGPPGDLKPI